MARRISLVAALLVALASGCSGSDERAAPVAKGVTAVGDSVMLGAAPDLEREIPGIAIDAREGRQFAEGLEVVRALRDAGDLGDIVVVALGTNGPITTELVDEMLGLLEGVDRVVFVSNRVPQPWEAPNNAILQEVSARYENVALVDWHSAGEGHPEYFWDGVHLAPDGARAFALLVSAEIENAS